MTRRGQWWRAVWTGGLAAQLVVVGCAPGSANLLDRARKGSFEEDAALVKAMDADPKVATLLALEHSFGLLRSGHPSADRLKRASGFLERAHASFEDLTDPANVNMAFAADEDKPYRGRPHERTLTAVMLAVADMAGGRCDMAIPTLRSAEFLDARWQPFPFGTDAPLVYALMLRCALHTDAAPSDVERARTGLRLAIRLKLGLDPALDLLYRAQAAMPRGGSIPTRLAAILYERALPAVLINRQDASTLEDLIGAAASEANRYLSEIDEALANPAVQAVLERVAELAPVAASPQAIKRQADTLLAPEIMRLDAAMRAVAAAAGSDDGDHPASALAAALAEADALTARIEAEVSRPRAVVRFAGRGPTVMREGQYDEMAVITPSKEGTDRAEIRVSDAGEVPTACGLHSGPSGSLWAVLCQKGAAASSKTPDATATADAAMGSGESDTAGVAAYTEALELWSSSYQATSVVGRRFDRVLEGRAQFKAGAENVSVVAAWTAWILFRVGIEILGACDFGEASSICVAVGLAVLAVAVLSIGVAGAVWIAGAVVNAAADGRYVHNLYESGQLLVTAEAP